MVCMHDGGCWLAGADMENGIYEGSSNQASVPSLKPADFIAGFVKGKPGNHYRFARHTAKLSPGLLLTPHRGA